MDAFGQTFPRPTLNLGPHPPAAPLEFNREKQQIHRVCLLILNPGAMRQDADGVSAAGVPAACPEPCRNRPRLWAGL